MLAERTTSIEMVGVDELKFAPFNPKSRTESKAVALLKLEIQKAGEIIVPLIVTKDNYIADGHRRLTVAKELGITKVPVVRKEWDLAFLWSVLNGGNMSVGKKTWMQAVREGMPLECVPEKEKKTISDLMRIVGRKMFEKISDSGGGPSIVIVARYVSRYCDQENDKFIKEIILWFMECNTQRDAKFACSTGCPVDILIEAIEQRRKIRQYWGTS